MRAIICQLTVFLVILSPTTFAKGPEPILPNFQPIPPKIAASAYLLIDFNSNQIIAQNKSDLRVEPASLTKMLTMYIVDNEIKAGRLKHTDQILVSNNAWKAPGSRMFLKPNTKVSVADLIKGIIIQSGNDACITIAEHIAGSEQAFAQLMNRYAQSLGMHNSHFVNATGLPHRNHLTSAQDMAILARAIIKNFPETYKIYATKEFSFNGIRQHNRNQLLWRHDNVDGIKTGHTDSAGFCLVASAKDQNNMRLIAVVMGTKNEEARTQETNKLLNWGFRFYETKLIKSAANEITQAKLWMGSDSKLNVGLEEDLYVTAPRGNFDKYTTTVKLNDMIKAPIERGTVVGNYVVKDHNSNIIMEHPLIALKTVESGNLFQRGIDMVRLNISTVVDKFRT